MLSSIIPYLWMILLTSLAALGIHYLLKRSLRIQLSLLEILVVIIPLAIGYLAYSYLILGILSLLVPITVVIVAILPLILFIFILETPERIFRGKKISTNSSFYLLRKFSTFFFKQEFYESLGLAIIIICLTILIDPKIYHYAMKKTDFYWFDTWKYWRLGRRVAASGQLSEPYVLDFYSHAIECFLASIFLPVNTVQLTIDVTKFFGLMMFFLEIAGIFVLVQIYLKPRVSRSIALTGGIVAMCFYVTAPIIIYHSLLVVHETLSIPLIFSLLIISVKIKPRPNTAYQKLLVIYLCLFWATSTLTLYMVSITMIIQRTFSFFRWLRTHQAKTWKFQILGCAKTWKTWLIVFYFILYPLLSIISSLDEIYYDISLFLNNLETPKAQYTSNKRMFRAVGLFDFANVIANSIGIIGTGVIFIVGIFLPRYWKYLEFNNSTRKPFQLIYGIFFLGLAFSLFWSVLPFGLFTVQFRLSLYVALAGSIIVGVSIGCFLQYTKKRVVNIKSNYLRLSLLKNAEKLVLIILLIQMIYGISLSGRVYMWEEEKAYHDLVKISNDLPVETGSIFCLEPDLVLVYMIEGVLFPKFEVNYSTFLVWGNQLGKPVILAKLTRYLQLLRDNNVNLFIIRRTTWNTTRQIYEETRLDILMTARFYKWDTPPLESWTKSWDEVWEELSGFQKFEYSQLLVVKLK
ncbi:MAG: hypothetical protein ACE5R6_14445 [Candidatus Heimdallarchaeota archaeon]